MKTPAKILTGLLLGATMLAAVPVLAQNANPPPPPAAAEDGGPDAGPGGPPPPDATADDEGGWGWWGHHGRHMGRGEMGRMGGGDCGGDGDRADGDRGGDGRGPGMWGHGRWADRDGPDGGRHGMGKGMMAMIDNNGDGAIGDDEAAAIADRMFARMDDNGDGALSVDEFASGRGGPGMHGGWRNWLGLNQDEMNAVMQVRKDKFTALDTDKNGSLSKPEFFAEAKARFAAADTDKDGKVTPWEFRAQHMN